MKARAVRIDIEEELEAERRGECIACRIGGTHLETEECSNTPLEYTKRMKKCLKCNHLFNSQIFGSICPICTKEIKKKNLEK